MLTVSRHPAQLQTGSAGYDCRNEAAGISLLLLRALLVLRPYLLWVIDDSTQRRRGLLTLHVDKRRETVWPHIPFILLVVDILELDLRLFWGKHGRRLTGFMFLSSSFGSVSSLRLGSGRRFASRRSAVGFALVFLWRF